MSVRIKNLKSVLSEDYNNEVLKILQNQKRLDRLENLMNCDYETEKTKILQNQKRLDRLENLMNYDYETEKTKIGQNQDRLDKIERLLGLYWDKFLEMEHFLAQNRQEAGHSPVDETFMKEFDFLGKRTNSQSGEDAILAYVVSRLQIPLDKCDYLDLGANHPIIDSNTNFFYSHGSRGVLVEANPQLIPDLRKYRSRDTVLNYCIDTEDGKQTEFVIMTASGLSTVDLDAVAEIQKINPSIQVKDRVSVQTITINTIFKEYFTKAPVICSVDVEGKDFEILSSLDFSKYRPLLIVVEMIKYSNQIALHDKRKDVLDLMRSSGYEEYAFTGINSIFIDRKALEEKWGY